MAKADPTHDMDPQASLFANAAQIIGARLDAMLAYEDCLSDPDRVYELHQMRIAAKRLRYTLEIFEEVYARYTRLGKEFTAAINVVKGLQERLGEIHDADVLVPQLTAHLAHLLEPGYGKERHKEPVVGVHQVDFDACQGLLTLCRGSRTDRDKQYQQLLRDWRKLRTTQFFERLCTLLHAAIAATSPTTALEDAASGPEESAPSAAAPSVKENAVHAQDRSDDSAPARPRARRVGQPRASAGSRRHAGDTGGHSGPRPDPDPGPAEGGTG